MNKDKIEKMLLEYGVHNFTINDDGTVDVDGDLLLWPHTLPFSMGFEEYFTFGMVNGDFHGQHNGLVTLEGLPNWVSGDYYVNHNHLTSLQHLPKYIGGDLYIHHNDLKEFDLEDTYIGGEIYAWSNPHLDKLNQEWAYSGERGVDKIGSIKNYYLLMSREKKINSIINA
jgi:hypothetical protein